MDEQERKQRQTWEEAKLYVERIKDAVTAEVADIAPEKTQARPEGRKRRPSKTKGNPVAATLVLAFVVLWIPVVIGATSMWGHVRRMESEATNHALYLERLQRQVQQLRDDRRAEQERGLTATFTDSQHLSQQVADIYTGKEAIDATLPKVPAPPEATAYTASAFVRLEPGDYLFTAQDDGELMMGDRLWRVRANAPVSVSLPDGFSGRFSWTSSSAARYMLYAAGGEPRETAQTQTVPYVVQGEVPTP